MVLNNTEVSEKPVPPAKKVPFFAVQFEALVEKKNIKE